MATSWKPSAPEQCNLRASCQVCVRPGAATLLQLLVATLGGARTGVQSASGKETNMQMLFAALLMAHGVAHLSGFAVPWRLVMSDDVPYRTDILGGSIRIGDTSAWLLGVASLLIGVAFVGLGVGLLLGIWSHATALTVVLLSAGLCVLGWPESRIGMVIDVVIVAVVLTGGRFAWALTP
jgi:hypothetical protein